ncbi:MAG TPA: hypothetical protein VJN92_01365 [Candidatus Acidoferrum sp.]|nr:hypothetical protein [Candidatus Acidoferrum sp.]
MSQAGYIFRQGNSWYVRYRHAVDVDGELVVKQKCEKLCDYDSNRYRSRKDVRDLAKEKIDKVQMARKHPQSARMFTTYVEQTWLPYAKRTTKPSTYAGRVTHWKRYIKPRVEKYALHDLTTAIIYGLLDDVARSYSVNLSTVSKIRSILFGMLKYAINTGELPSGTANPAKDVMLPECAPRPEPTEAATRGEVQALLAALKGQPLARAAIGILAFCGVRPGEARGLRWEEWDRAEKQIHVCRSIWHRVVSTPKTEKSVRFVTVTDELRAILLDLWNAKGCPFSGYILAGRNDWPVILDNLTKRVIQPAAEKASIAWKECYALRRFHGTEVRMKSNGKTAAEALGNSQAVFEKHYDKPTSVYPDVRRAVNDAFSGLVQ